MGCSYTGMDGGATATEKNTPACAVAGVTASVPAMMTAASVVLKAFAIFIYVPVLPLLRCLPLSLVRQVARMARTQSILPEACSTLSTRPACESLVDLRHTLCYLVAFRTEGYVRGYAWVTLNESQIFCILSGCA